jgi:hypothetical protein
MLFFPDAILFVAVVRGKFGWGAMSVRFVSVVSRGGENLSRQFFSRIFLRHIFFFSWGGLEAYTKELLCSHCQRGKIRKNVTLDEEKFVQCDTLADGRH